MGRWRRQNGNGNGSYDRQPSSSSGTYSSQDSSAPSTSTAETPNGGASTAGNGSKRKWNKKKKKNSKNNWQRNAAPFPEHELTLIRSYLVDYRDRAEQLYDQHHHHQQQPGNEGAASAPVDEEPQPQPQPQPLILGQHTFPALTRDILTQPYFTLPTTLSAKARRTIHQLCVEIGLYHGAIGDRGLNLGEPNGRRLVVSVFANGLDFVEELRLAREEVAGGDDSNKNAVPWYYRNDHVSEEDEMDSNKNEDEMEKVIELNRQYVQNATQQGLQAIEALIDQPGNCLRDEYDSIDYAELDGVDLSQYHVLPNPDESSDGSNWMLVDTPEKMKQCITEVTDPNNLATELGVDLEAYNKSRYDQRTCLIQLHANGKDYVIDTLAPGVWDTVPLLQPIFSDPAIVKIGHSVRGTDAPCLHRDFGIFVVNCFDTHEAAKVLHLKSHSLVGVLDHYGIPESGHYYTLKRQYQNTDWTRRPLTKEMMEYGRYDCHYLTVLRRLMIRDLTRRDLYDKSSNDVQREAQMVAEAIRAVYRAEDGTKQRDTNGDASSVVSRVSSVLSDDGGYFTAGEDSFVSLDERQSVYTPAELRMHPALMRTISLSQDGSVRLWKDEQENPTSCDTFIDVIKRSAQGAVSWDDSNTDLYLKLAEWRDSVAKREGTFGAAACSLELLVSISQHKPCSESFLRKIEWILPTVLETKSKRYCDELLSIVRASSGENGTANSDRNGNIRLYPSIASTVSGEHHSSDARRWLRVALLTLTAVGVVALMASSRSKRRH